MGELPRLELTENETEPEHEKNDFIIYRYPLQGKKNKTNKNHLFVKKRATTKKRKQKKQKKQKKQRNILTILF